MKLKKRIKKLEAEFSRLKGQIEKDSITITDSCIPDLKAVLSLKNGVFLLEKITSTTQINQQIILKDNKEQ